MLKRLVQITIILSATGLLTGCPKLYIAFEKHGGAFLAPVKGHEFVHLPNDAWGSNENAMVYFYRPISQWAEDEIDAPSVYIDDQHYFNLRGNGYTWLEMAPGTRRLTLRRPLGLALGFEGFGHFALDLITDAEFELEPGKVYYFRYSEVSPPSASNPDLPADHLLATGDMQLVSRDVAFEEITRTRLMHSRPPFAKSNAGISIVERNKEDTYEATIADLEVARKAEIEKLKEEGHYRKAKWYWPFGGGPTRRLETDLKIEKVEREWEDYQAELQRQKELEEAGKKKWWKFF
ncbi:MAG: hypothetical protein CSA52_01125 [Gammaproteobacteria bacterium]|nr:MAG: hypothetical protein CSB48_13035 [Pseudomonadota bacterium]PIE38783.1 MAG: hypothetical protein CSA52_01125 [Gammaproteobacteria bacterium]